MVDEGRAFLDAGEGAIGADRDRTQIIVVADAAHHEILTLGRGFRSCRRASAELARPFLRLRRSPVVDGHFVAAFFHQMSCHRETHHAETEKSDFSHVFYPGVWPASEEEPDSVFGGGRPHHKPCAMKGNG